jgi:NADH-quinone oxidoreductase subunit L
LFTAFLTAFYMTRLFVVAFLGNARTDAARHGHDGPMRMTLPLVILAIFSVVAGWGTESYFTTHAEGAAAHGHSLVPMLLAIIAFLAGTIAAYEFYKGKNREALKLPLFRQKFYFDEMYGAIVAGTQELLAYIANAIDTMISAVTRALGMAAWGAGFVMRLIQFGNLQGYSIVFGLGVVALIWFLIFA